MNMQEVYKYLSTVLPEGHVKQDEMLKNHTHIKVGGKADVFVAPTNYDEIQEVIKYANEYNIPVTFLEMDRMSLLKMVEFAGLQ